MPQLLRFLLFLICIATFTSNALAQSLHWAANYLNENHIPVTYWNLVEKACVFKLKDNLLVRQILLEEIYFAGDVQNTVQKSQLLILTSQNDGND